MGRHSAASNRGNNGSHGARASAAGHQGRQYDAAFRLFESGKHDEARKLYLQLDADGVDPEVRADAINSLAVLDALDERFHAAREGFKRALSVDSACDFAKRNLAMLESCGCGEQDDCDVEQGEGRALHPPTFPSGHGD